MPGSGSRIAIYRKPRRISPTSRKMDATAVVDTRDESSQLRDRIGGDVCACDDARLQFFDRERALLKQRPLPCSLLNDAHHEVASGSELRIPTDIQNDTRWVFDLREIFLQMFYLAGERPRLIDGVEIPKDDSSSLPVEIAGVHLNPPQPSSNNPPTNSDTTAKKSAVRPAPSFPGQYR